MIHELNRLESKVNRLERELKQREKDIIELVKFLNHTKLIYEKGKVEVGYTDYGKATIDV